MWTSMGEKVITLNLTRNHCSTLTHSSAAINKVNGEHICLTETAH